MRKAIIFNARGNQPEEVIYPYYRLQEENVEVKVIGVGETDSYKGRKVIFGKYGIPTPCTDDVSYLDTIEHDSIAVIVVPGGHECPEIIRQEKKVVDFIRLMYEKGTLIASLCHGPLVLISAGILKGKQATCYPGMKDDLINAGAIYQDSPVVVDGNLITSPHYKNSPEFMRAVIDSNLFKKE